MLGKGFCFLTSYEKGRGSAGCNREGTVSLLLHLKMAEFSDPTC
jgi:hypothetical protein